MIVKRSIIIWSFFDAIFKRSHDMTCELAQCNESNSLHRASCYFSVSFHDAPITPYENFCEEKLCFSMCHSEIILRCLSSSLVLRNKEYVAQWTSSKNWIKIGIHSLTHSLTHSFWRQKQVKNYSYRLCNTRFSHRMTRSSAKNR